MKKNKTNRAGAAAGLSPHSRQTGKNRKRPKGVGAPMGQVNKNNNYTPYCIRKNGGCQDE